ncbi:unnamed protein product [Chilo suppressalis]|uniref:Alpha N-terminal protein methyltransferase 1 n=1 Tax=Chilo suppressalis TaxID=168631 RepID=A0ABN8BCQ1_CHISP|nr:unnamed protein product [Chilo suppressalis]
MNSINYGKALEYWADVPPTVDGVLGGFGFISDLDINGSKIFLESLFSSESGPGCTLALDCGAGIGRISKHLLLEHFETVDIVEPDLKFINSIREFVGEGNSKICQLYNVSLQEFKPERKYDVIWNQWVLGYLTDGDLVSYLIRCSITSLDTKNMLQTLTVNPFQTYPRHSKTGSIWGNLDKSGETWIEPYIGDALTDNGVIIVKENVTSTGKAEKDETDSSITRSLKQFTKIFKSANLKRIKQSKQTNFPSGIYPVYMFALVPIKSIAVEV